jgi:hypothetical protein
MNLALGFALVAAVFASASGLADAAPFATQDSVTGAGHYLAADFIVSIRSGPKGEDPSGSLSIPLVEGIDSSTPTCLTVQGKQATVGVRVDSGSSAGQGFVAVVTDNGPPVGGRAVDEVNYFSLRTAPPTSCPAPSTFPLSRPPGSLLTSGDIVVTDASPFMVGKGSVPGDGGAGRPGGTASYAYIVPCNARLGSTPPFEVRISGGKWDGRRFRLTGQPGIMCTTDPLFPSPAGFNVQYGSGVASDSAGGTMDLLWLIRDGGPSNSADFFQLSIYPRGGPQLLFFGAAQPPGKFPGSSQTTGFNTAR